MRDNKTKTTHVVFRGLLLVYTIVFSILSSLKIVGITGVATWSWWKIVYMSAALQGAYYLILLVMGLVMFALGAVGIIVKEVVEK